MLLSNQAKAYIKYIFFTWLLLAVMRLGFFLWQHSAFKEHPAEMIAKAFSIGLRFDARIAVIFAIPVICSLFIPLTRMIVIPIRWLITFAFFGVVIYFFYFLLTNASTLGNLAKEHFFDNKQLLPFLRSYWDLLLACALLFLFPILLVGSRKFRLRFRQFVRWLASPFVIPHLIIFIIYAIDFNHYGYLEQRLAFSTLELMEENYIALRMLWQSYPVFESTFVIIGITYITSCISKKICAYTPEKISMPKRIFSYVFCLLFSALLIMGQVSSSFFPLRWSQAHFTIHKEITALGTNPIQNLWDTFPKQEGERFSLEKAQKGFPLVADYLQIPYEANSMRLDRIIPRSPENTANKPNVVLIIMESLSTHKSSFAAPQVDATPFAAGLANESLYFPNHFASARTTSKAIFSILTGIPDLNVVSSTSSRDLKAVDQNIIINQFKGYKRFYCLGGDANWANIRGMLKANIEELELIEEGQWKATSIDVWGVSDLDLFKETHAILARQKDPFFAVIQSSSFHRPFTVPPVEETPGMDRTMPDEETLEKYGFTPDEFLSMRFADYAMGEFFRLAKTAKYYENTIFVVVGDHGISERSPAIDATYQALRLHSYHVPLIVHFPQQFNEGIVNEMATGHIDILPTIASLAGIPYHNTTLGRNVLDPDIDPERFSFIRIGNSPVLVSKDRVLSFLHYNENNEGAEYNEEPVAEMYTKEGITCTLDTEVSADEMKQASTLAQALFNVGQYLLFNNTKAAAKAYEQTHNSPMLP